MNNLKVTRKLIQGNEAIAQGALDAGAEFFAGYPITPASEIMHFLADKKIVFMQPEDELASVNMCIGASLAGKKSMTATSGPGFSLMQEGIGFAHMTRTPIVIVNSQRVGPATGMPTLPNQGDILQTKNGSHGDYVPIVFYPNSVQELYEYTIHSFNASEKAKIPVILLSDQILSHMYESVEFEYCFPRDDLLMKKASVSIKTLNSGRKEKPLGENKKHVTGLLSKDNVPQTMNSEYYKKWFEEYKKDVLKVAENYEGACEYIENKNADTLIICFGAVSRIVYSLKNKYSIFRPIRIFPVLEKQIQKISEKYKQVVVIEMNDAQYAGELKKFLGDKVKSISILGGKIDLEEIKKELEKKI